MAHIYTYADADYDAIKVTDIDPPSLAAADQEVADFIRTNGTTPKRQPPRAAHQRERGLRAMDLHYGPLVLGEFTVSRVELHLMNAMAYGDPLDIGNTNFRIPPQSFIDSLQLDPADVERRMRASTNVGDYTIPTLLFEIVTLRSPDADPLLSHPQSPHMQKTDRLLQAAQKLDIHDLRLPQNVPGWVDRQKSNVVNSMGVGLQAFGIYSGLMGINDALKRGDRSEAVVSAGAVVTELGSLIIERGLVKGAQEMIENSALIYQGFAKTRFGLHLSRGAGLIAGVFTLPFDIYFAVKALDEASRTTGKQAVDHYVSAGMSLASAALTLILGTAALAGFAHAGPVGIAAAAILIVGSQIYSAVRQVDEIDDYIELSADERLVTGFLAFICQSPPQGVADRYSIALAESQHSKMLTSRARRWLDGQMKNSIEAIVNGKVDVSLKTVEVIWFEPDDTMGSKDIKVPRIEDGNDTIDARNGIPEGLAGVVKGTEDASKATLWLLGGGDDAVTGVEKKPNQFSFGAGFKRLTGGEKDDHFLFEGAEQALKQPALSGLPANTLLGGDGNDTLTFQGKLNSRDTQAWDGYQIDLDSGLVRMRKSDGATSTLHTILQSVENVETLAGAQNVVQGSAGANRIVSRGHDQINAGDGDDTIYMLGGEGSAAGGAGKDHYYVAQKSGTVTIKEDAGEESVIMMEWPFEAIQKWTLEGTSLVISSLCGKDGEWPERKLVIKDLYKSEGSKRIYQEQKLRLLTQDGFQLAPDLPDELEGFEDHSVNVLILVNGKRPALHIINHPAHDLSGAKLAHYFIDREIISTSFNISSEPFNSGLTFNIDHDSTEITSAQTTYTVEVSHRNENTYLTYTNFKLQLWFQDKTLTLQNFIDTPAGKYSDIVDPPYLVNWRRMKQQIILTMRDGVSYKIKDPSLRHIEDFKTPGNKQLNGLELLQKRHGNYWLNSPKDNKPLLLAPRPQRIDFSAQLQSTVAVLEGSGSIYHVHFLGDTTLRISTPGALKKTSNASTWYFYSRNDLSGAPRLSDRRLLAGRCIIHLPEYTDENTPVEVIYVITPSGTTYAIDLIFEQVYIHGVITA